MTIKQVSEKYGISELTTSLSEYFHYAFDRENALSMLKEHFGVADISIYGVSGMKTGICAAGALMRYLHETQKNMLMHVMAKNLLHAFMSQVLEPG